MFGRWNFLLGRSWKAYFQGVCSFQGAQRRATSPLPAPHAELALLRNGGFAIGHDVGTATQQLIPRGDVGDTPTAMHEKEGYTLWSVEGFKRNEHILDVQIACFIVTHFCPIMVTSYTDWLFKHEIITIPGQSLLEYVIYESSNA